MAAVIGYVGAALPLVFFVWAIKEHDSELLYGVLTAVTLVPPTLALLGSMARFERQSKALLLVAAGLFGVLGLLLLPLLAAAVLCLSAMSETITPAAVGLLVVGTLCFVSAGRTGVPLDEDYCITADAARETSYIEQGFGWWPPGFRCIYTSRSTGTRIVHTKGGFWPLALGSVAVGSFTAGAALWARARKPRTLDHGW